MLHLKHGHKTAEQTQIQTLTVYTHYIHVEMSFKWLGYYSLLKLKT